MFARPAIQSRLLLTICALVAETLHIGWEYTHGGVLAHHLLANPELPAISNWWGLLVVPLLVWHLVGRIQRRAHTLVQAGSRERFRSLAQVRFTVALLWGAALALAFTLGHPAVTFIFFGAFAAALFVHAYRAEYVLGFALGMTFTFGAVLPVLVASVIAACSFLVHLLAGAAMRLARGGRARGAGLP
ncbi:hypothetical protein [Massilia yuzhufengensis]|uniref:Uncharacterized protein n=1 Tax=Massilia yuzhufengensis TaxID=1164594 RepID=A0A1I1N6N1_9BURK|nr:hypothetical protein [Massilia yuzhufengensis]SFC93279.1 hypothetical protein SAMN05216204_112103 [Massilia yuzhufengensis]